MWRRAKFWLIVVAREAFSLFSALKELKNRGGRVSLPGRVSFKEIVSRRIFQLRRIARVDTQKIRRKALLRLQEIFDVASAFARGEIERVKEGAQEKAVTLKQRQMWARIAAYTAQIMNTVADGIDERQIDKDLDKLEKMVDEAKAKSEAKEARTGPPGSPA